MNTPGESGLPSSKGSVSGAAPKTEAAGTPPAPGMAAVASEPEKPKKKYSKGFAKLAQKGEVGFTRGAHRVASAIEDGLATWRDRRKASSYKKRNGALKDAVKNGGKALTKFSKGIAKLPEDITKDLPKVRIFR